MLLLLLACASDDVTWAVHHASVIPTATGLGGTQTWEFFTEAWAKDHAAETFRCARAQLLAAEATGALTGCDGCLVTYAVTASELDTTCGEPQASDVAYANPITTFAIGDVPDELASDDPYPGRSLGWYVSLDGETLTPYGWAYEEALDWEGRVGGAGWVNGQTYTLWPAFAWDLR